MRDFSVDLVWTKVQIAITAIGGWVGYFVGGMDGMLIALIVLMSLDYISGVMCAIVDRKLSSA
ncbi:MAG: phage holin family protein, partial [bacterium]